MTSGLPAAAVRRQVLLLGPLFLARKFGSARLQQALNRPSVEAFEKWLLGGLEPCEVFHCLSGHGLQVHRTARQRYGALTVTDRGSSHIVYQNDLLRSEYERWGLAYSETSRWFIEREEAEYDECDLITVPSQFAYRSFVAKGIPESKLALIPYGVDLREFRPMRKQDNIFRVLYVGQLSIRKGIPYLLAAVAPLRLPDFEVVLIGDGLEARDLLEQHQERIHYIGAKARTELYRFYSQASVFVIASVEEGLAMVMAQAMACGLPVIATTNTGAEDLFSDGVEGYIVPICSPEAIRQKVVYLYENPEVREQMSQAALRRVQDLGGWDHYGERAAATYQKALTEQP